MQLVHERILSTFMVEFPKLVDDMRSAVHNYDSKNLNPYHMEGTVWTHTMMVFNEAIRREYSPVVQLAALLHDVGKPKACEVRHDNRRVGFFGHDGLSYYISCDVMNSGVFDFLNLTDYETHTVLKLTACHSMLFDYKKSKNIQNIQRDNRFLKYLVALVNCDNAGRITSDLEQSKCTWDHLLISDSDVSNISEAVLSNCETENLSNDMSKLNVLVGPSNSGKSTYLKSLNDSSVVISRDSIVETMGDGETYNECWKTVDHKKVDEELMFQFNAALKKRENITVDMTNMSVKSRRKWVNPAKQIGYTTKAVVFTTGLEEMTTRAIKQKDKKISTWIIEKMCKQFAYPMEFDEAEVVV